MFARLRRGVDWREPRRARSSLAPTLLGGEQLSGLLAVIADPAAAWDERSDALTTVRHALAWEAEGPGTEALRSEALRAALVAVATNPAELAALQDEAGEALANLWLNERRFDGATFARLAPHAQEAARDLIAANAPGWLAPK